MHNTKVSRRQILKGIASIPVVAAVGFHATASAEMVSADDPTAKALNYTEKSEIDGQTCANCQLYQGGAEKGGCQIFGGKEVTADGWCKSWVVKG
ncbi:MAG: high-potential iron-sulfur protein [Pseudomonadota bacterium]